jgi:hypothetical protein
VPPEVNVVIDALPRLETGVAGLRRQDIYDYAHTTDVRRLAQWHLRPETEVPTWQASDWVELWIRGGEIAVNGEPAHANCFVVIEPGATVRIASPYGAPRAGVGRRAGALERQRARAAAQPVRLLGGFSDLRALSKRFADSAVPTCEHHAVLLQVDTDRRAVRGTTPGPNSIRTCR